MTLTLNLPWYNYLSVLAVLDEDEQTLINMNIVDKEKVKHISKVVNISLNSFIPDLFLPSGHIRAENNYCYVEVSLLHNNRFFLE